MTLFSEAQLTLHNRVVKKVWWCSEHGDIEREYIGYCWLLFLARDYLGCTYVSCSMYMCFVIHGNFDDP